MPDRTTETFETGSDHGGNDHADGRGVRYLEWTWDPDPPGGWTQTEYAFVLRRLGPRRARDPRHGLFGRADWLRLLAGDGFDPSTVPEITGEDRTPRDFFVGHRRR